MESRVTRSPMFSHHKVPSAGATSASLGTSSSSGGAGSSGVVSAVPSPATTLQGLLECFDDAHVAKLQGSKVALSAWRTEPWMGSAAVAGLDVAPPTSGLSYAGHCSVHNKHPYVLFGNAGDEARKCVLVDALTGTTFASDQEFSATATHLHGNVALFGAREGSIKIFRLDQAMGQGGFSPLWHSYVPEQGVSKQGLFGTRSSIDNIVCSRSEKTFAATENNAMHMWDFNRNQAPVASVSCWPFGQRTVSISSDDEAGGTLYLLGSESGVIQCLDERALAKAKTGAAAWKIQGVHGGGTVRCLLWHPHVSHWFASGGQDGAVHIWDSRFLRQSVAEMPLAHPTGVVGMAWCRTHSEILATVGVARSLSLWNMRHDDSKRGIGFVPGIASGRPLGIGWAIASEDGTSPAVCIGDAKGVVSRVTLRHAFLKPLCPPQVKNDAARSLIYTRDLPAAFQLVVDRAQLLCNSGRFDEALNLVEMCYPRALSVLELPPNATAAVATKAFHDDMLSAASFLPPNFSIPPQANNVLSSIKRLRLTLRLHQMKSRDLWKEAFAYTDEICKYIKKTADRGEKLQLGADVLRDVVALVMQHHFLSGITMGSKIIHALKEDEYPNYQALTRVLLSPTVFDGYVGGLAQAPVSSESVFLSKKVGVSQIDFVKDFTIRMWNENPFQRIDKMMRKTEQVLVSVSATVNRVYLLSLLQCGQYLNFFLVASTIATATPGCEFSSVIVPRQILPIGEKLSLEWCSLVLDELRNGFDVEKARQLARLSCVVIVRSQLLGVSRPAVDKFLGLLQKLVSIVPGRDAAAALMTTVSEVVPSNQSEQMLTNIVMQLERKADQ